MSAPIVPANSRLTRLHQTFQWRKTRTQQWLRAAILRLPPRWSIRLRWPLRKPWQLPALRLASYGGGIGDELMCVAVFQEIKRRNPACRITFVSRFPELFSRFDFLHSVERHSPATTAGTLSLAYGPPVPPPRPLVTHLGECVGLEDLPSVPPELPPLAPSPVLPSQIDALPHPRVVIQPLASRWTPVKQWPLPNWIALVRRLVEHFTVIEVGTEAAFAGENFGPQFHSFAGQTSIDDFLWLIGQGDVFIGPSSGGMHVAAAHGLPSVIIFGGYETPQGYHYPRTTPFYRPVECAPCWRTDECPYGLTCMQQITPDEVFVAVRQALGISAD